MIFKGGYVGKILRVDLSTKQYKTEPVNEDHLLKLLGGRGLAAKMYYDEIGPEVKPFDEANKIFFITGPLTGVNLPSTTKFQLSTRSPETGMYLCSNCGGDFGPGLKQCGFDGMIIEGKASEWTYLMIRDGDVSFCDARSMLGQNSHAAMNTLKEAIGDPKAAAMSVGPAAERLVRISYINVDTRAFGRGGGGAVFGSKRLKGIVLKGSGTIPVADKEKVDEIRKAAVRDLRDSRANHTKYGTAQYIEPINELGCMPTRNFQTTYFEKSDTVNADTMYEEYLEKNYACFHCTVACGKVCEVKNGPFAGARARTEYETVALLGPNCGIDDFGAVVKGNQLCDEMGIDTMSAGNAVALTMELYERGLITEQDTDGIEARFGNAQAMIDIIRLIAERRCIGDLLAEGMAGVARERPEWRPYILAVKGMPFAAYDPRGFYGNALTYGTSNRGACHNVGGWTIRAELQSGQYDRFALKGKGALVKSIQDNRAYVDSLGLCTVVRGSMNFSAQPDGEVMTSVTGYDFTPLLLAIGSRIYTLERLILSREGIRRKDDMMPERVFKEAVPSGPIKGRVLTEEMYAEMLDEYYDERGWDKDGVPSEQTLAGLGLSDLI
ncbi:MAG TPA: aldehyde ferredoxin oxidoreductase [Spirochaetes bacterium]|nr:aldehyde ferredoxin oxidoreductase [Spirochaetota bacterium]